MPSLLITPSGPCGLSLIKAVALFLTLTLVLIAFTALRSAEASSAAVEQVEVALEDRSIPAAASDFVSKFEKESKYTNCPHRELN